MRDKCPYCGAAPCPASDQFECGTFDEEESADCLRRQLATARSIIADLMVGDPNVSLEVGRAAVAFADGGPITCPACAALLKANATAKATALREAADIAFYMSGQEEKGDPVGSGMYAVGHALSVYAQQAQPQAEQAEQAEQGEQT